LQIVQMTISILPTNPSVNAGSAGIVLQATVSNPPSTPTVTWTLTCINSDDEAFPGGDFCGDDDSDADGPGGFTGTNPTSGSSSSITYVPPSVVKYGFVDVNVLCPAPSPNSFAYVPVTATAQATGSPSVSQTVCVQVIFP
jgi:hypothetical protein